MEAEGVLPLAIGEATKLVQFLMNAKKEYKFTIKFGAMTDTGDASGKIIKTTEHVPSKAECETVCSTFIGALKQIPPVYSALKVNGKRAYNLARQGKEVKLSPREIQIYNLACLDYNEQKSAATYRVECSKGTYIRTLAEDIALSLQSLGFVLELRRTRVGSFIADNAIKAGDLERLEQDAALVLLARNKVKIEAVLDDIPVLDATAEQAQKIRFGQKCYFPPEIPNIDILWIRWEGNILAIGSLKNNSFISSRVFNLII